MNVYSVPTFFFAILHLTSIFVLLIKFKRSPETFLAKLFLNTYTTISAVRILMIGIFIHTVSFLYSTFSNYGPIHAILHTLGTVCLLFFYIILIKVQLQETEVSS